jgi:hypothetical protein
VTQETDRVRLDRAGEAPADISRAELLDLYRIVVDEYRFQVKLNWDRTQYYFVLSTALMTAGGALLATLKEWGAIVSMFVFVLGCTSAIIGRQSVIQGHEYYRRIMYRKTLIEDLLGRLHKLPGYVYAEAGLSLITTRGMADARKILDETESYFAEPLRPRSVTHSMVTIMRAFVIVQACGVALAMIQIYRLLISGA